MQPIYNLFYIKNKLLDFLWKLNAVTLAAQILTVPLSIYHFHQFPNLFILTNFIAVPLSSIILLGEILICAVSFIPALASLAGKIVSWLIGLMNDYIQRIESIPFSLWDSLQISLIQAILLLLAVIGISYWLLERSVTGLKLGLLFLLSVIALRSDSFIRSNRQQELIVYNVPQKKAIDIISRREYSFIGDTSLIIDDFARNFHLKPSRVLHRVIQLSNIPGLSSAENYLSFHGKHILLLDRPIFFPQQQNKPVIDLLVISRNPRVRLSKLAAGLNIQQVVADGTVPYWKTAGWKKECDSLGIPWHDVTANGAFVMNLR